MRDEWLYRRPLIERLSDRRAFGRHDFDARHSVADNLLAAARDHEIPHYFKTIGDRQVLHLVVELGRGEPTERALRALSRRIGSDTIELNYKAPAGGRTPFGHTAVRVGDGATSDLIGDPSSPPARRLMRWWTGQRTVSYARRRNLRRFFESRIIQPGKGETVFRGYLFRASRAEIEATRAIYERRIGQVREFSINGGDASKGVFSCGSFLTHQLPFLNSRGVPASIAAEDIAEGAEHSRNLDAVIEYRLPPGT
jgi:hypothetical protein